jgi:hypothetical protein
MRLGRLWAAVAALGMTASAGAQGLKPSADLSNVRGFNYTSTLDRAISGGGHAGLWLKYDAAQTERDLANAQRLNLNQVRVFVAYSAWKQDRDLSNRNLLVFLRAAQAHGMGVMLGLMDQPRPVAPSTELSPDMKVWLEDMVKLTAKEPALQFWDAANEPDYTGRGGGEVERTRRIKIAVETADLLHAVEKQEKTRTPVTIGCTLVPCLKDTEAAVDVLSFHDYSSTRDVVEANIAKAQAFAAEVKKPVFNTEIACVGRSNPYDMALEEFQKGHMGWYLWELTITHEWGDVHGVFYPDGTVRDPTIVAAIMGFFRNRGADTVLENPDREGYVRRAVRGGEAWLAEANPDWQAGLKQAEMEANILEAAQLVAMREPPTRTVSLMRAGAPDLPKLQELVRKQVAELLPYENPPRADPAAAVPSGAGK